jgi:photosystem II stability/assembly factor-like uncharacterized protein
MKKSLITKVGLIGLCIIANACKKPMDQSATFAESKFKSMTITGPYTWKPLKVGAGGWIVGLDIHPTEPGLMYARADVSGAYRWNPVSNSWKQLVTESSMPANYVSFGTYEGVNSIVGAPSNPDMAYMAFSGQIFRSTNRGDSWVATSFGTQGVTMQSNGVGRQEGERLAVDPINSDIVYYGSINNQLWLTTNGGNAWQKITSIPAGTPLHGVNTVVFDGLGNTSSTLTQKIYVTVDGVGVYQTTDGGINWTNISGSGPGARSYRDAEIGPDGTYYIASTAANGYNGAVWKYSASGSWTDITPSGSQSYEDIAVDPTNGNRLVVMKQAGSAWLSTNQGTSWLSKGFTRNSTSIDWIDEQTDWFMGVGELKFDPLQSGKLWFAEGFGIWQTTNLIPNQIPWFEQAAGIEETVGNAVICPPGGKPISAMADIGAFYHKDPDQYNAIRRINSFISGWGLDWSPANPAFVVGTFQDHTNGHPIVNATGYSSDGGQNWITFPAVANHTAPADLTYGTIAVSATSVDNIVWLPTNNKLPYFTTDKGVTWQQGVFTGLTSSGVTDVWNNRKPLCADRVDAGTFYFYHAASGIFRTTNSGANWSKVGNGPAASRWNAHLKAAPGHAKHLWFVEGKQDNVVGGLWRSKDGGVTWAGLPGVNQAYSFGFGKASAIGGYPAIFLTGVISGVHGIYRSDDEGATWEQIGTFPMGIFDIIEDMDGDKDVSGKVYVCFKNTGFAYGQP